MAVSRQSSIFVKNGFLRADLVDFTATLCVIRPGNASQWDTTTILAFTHKPLYQSENPPEKVGSTLLFSALDN